MVRAMSDNKHSYSDTYIETLVFHSLASGKLIQNYQNGSQTMCAFDVVGKPFSVVVFLFRVLERYKDKAENEKVPHCCGPFSVWLPYLSSNQEHMDWQFE